VKGKMKGTVCSKETDNASGYCTKHQSSKQAKVVINSRLNGQMSPQKTIQNDIAQANRANGNPSMMPGSGPQLSQSELLRREQAYLHDIASDIRPHKKVYTGMPRDNIMIPFPTERHENFLPQPNESVMPLASNEPKSYVIDDESDFDDAIDEKAYGNPSMMPGSGPPTSVDINDMQRKQFSLAQEKFRMSDNTYANPGEFPRGSEEGAIHDANNRVISASSEHIENQEIVPQEDESGLTETDYARKVSSFYTKFQDLNDVFPYERIRKLSYKRQYEEILNHMSFSATDGVIRAGYKGTTMLVEKFSPMIGFDTTGLTAMTDPETHPEISKYLQILAIKYDHWMSTKISAEMGLVFATASAASQVIQQNNSMLKLGINPQIYYYGTEEQKQAELRRIQNEARIKAEAEAKAKHNTTTAPNQSVPRPRPSRPKQSIKTLSPGRVTATEKKHNTSTAPNQSVPKENIELDPYLVMEKYEAE
jgi:hypothetical protein